MHYLFHFGESFAVKSVYPSDISAHAHGNDLPFFKAQVPAGEQFAQQRIRHSRYCFFNFYPNIHKLVDLVIDTLFLFWCNRVPPLFPGQGYALFSPPIITGYNCRAMNNGIYSPLLLLVQLVKQTEQLSDLFRHSQTSFSPIRTDSL